MTNLIKISDIWIDYNIYNEVKRRGLVWPEIYEENVMDCATLPLTSDRLDRITDNTTTTLPPVRLKKINSMYRIIDGRHRIANAIIKNISSIEAEIDNN
jgi:hypothetical protein